LVRAQVLGESGDALSQQRDLHLGRAGVVGLAPIRIDDFRFAVLRDRHRVSVTSAADDCSALIQFSSYTRFSMGGCSPRRDRDTSLCVAWVSHVLFLAG